MASAPSGTSPYRAVHRETACGPGNRRRVNELMALLISGCPRCTIIVSIRGRNIERSPI